MIGTATRAALVTLALCSSAPTLAQDVALAVGGSAAVAALPVAPVRLAEPIGTVVINEAALVGREIVARPSRPSTVPTGLLPVPSGLLPVAARISSGFGLRVHPIDGVLRAHTGLDLAAPYGTPIVSTMTGAVLSSGWHGGYGIMVEVSDGSRATTRYAHMSRALVSPGQAVTRGQVLGYVGSTGHSTGAHVHYELRVDGRALNPTGNAGLMDRTAARLRSGGASVPIVRAVF